MNNVFLIGRITKDLELKHTANGTSFCRFTLAVNRPPRQDQEPEADFVGCVAWSKTAELMAGHLSKGSKVALSGRIQTGSYKDNDGRTVYTTDIVADRCEFLDGKPQAQGQAQEQPEGFAAIEEDIPF